MTKKRLARSTRPLRIDRTKTGLLVIDVQERLLPSIFEAERIIANALRMLKGANILHVPVFVTEQYRKGLGPTHKDIASSLDSFAPVQKVVFSACGAEGFLAALKAKKVRDVLLCGIEAHVCISQTCLDLLDRGFRVFVIADAVSSRTADNVAFALERMRDS